MATILVSVIVGKKEQKTLIHEEITAVVWNTHEAVFCSSMKNNHS